MHRIKQLLDDRLMSDVTLIIDGKEFNAHRLFLCSISDVFQVIEILFLRKQIDFL